MPTTTTTPDDIPPCEQCGHPHVTWHGHQACTGHLSARNPRNPGGPCTQPPIDGLTVCEHHGGASGNARAAGRRNTAIANAEKTLAKLIPDNPEPVRNPIAVLARLAGEADSVRAAIAGKINAADTVDEALAWTAPYERFLDRTARICGDLVKANYIEKHAAIEAADAARLLGGVQSGLNLIPDPILRRQVAQAIADNIRGLQNPDTAA